MSVEPSFYSCPDDLERLVHEFETCVLPRELWTHHAHLAVALWYLTCYCEAEAVERLRRNIRRYRRHSYQSHGLEVPQEGGYHETLTLFYVRVIRKHIREATPETTGSLADVANAVIRAWGDKSLVFAYYSRDRLLSAEARMNWVEPDLQPLD